METLILKRFTAATLATVKTKHWSEERKVGLLGIGQNVLQNLVGQTASVGKVASCEMLLRGHFSVKDTRNSIKIR